MMSRNIREWINYIIYLTKIMKINNWVKERINNSAKFDKLEFLDENNDKENKENYILIFHWFKEYI